MASENITVTRRHRAGGSSPATSSTCSVIGKMSKARNEPRLQPSSKRVRTSRAKDAGSHETYAIRRRVGPSPANARMTPLPASSRRGRGRPVRSGPCRTRSTRASLQPAPPVNWTGQPRCGACRHRRARCARPPTPTRRARPPRPAGPNTGRPPVEVDGRAAEPDVVTGSGRHGTEERLGRADVRLPEHPGRDTVSAPPTVGGTAPSARRTRPRTTSPTSS